MDTKNIKILVVDDHPQIAHILKSYAEREGYDVIVAADGLEALNLFKREAPQVVLLDVAMPKLDGFEVCRVIRRDSDAIIIMVTARTEDYDRIMGLDIGADDYIVKPFSPAEVMARVRANLRRLSDSPAAQHHAETDQAAKQSPYGLQSRISLADLTVDLDEYQVTVQGETIALTKREVELIWLLAGHPNQVLSRDLLLERLWGDAYDGDQRTVDSHIKRLRAKLGEDQVRAWMIETVRGVGYRLIYSADRGDQR